MSIRNASTLLHMQTVYRNLSKLYECTASASEGSHSVYETIWYSTTLM
jgi:hypothetical protein